MKTDSTKRKFLNVIAELNEEKSRCLEYVHALAAGVREMPRHGSGARNDLIDRAEIGA
ncbi:MAG: hypothetical protein ACLUI3_08815 [Christensenellales bacterium]